MNIGTGIKLIRKSKGISQGELAEKCGLSQASLSQIENGLKRPSAKNMKKLCDVLDVPEIFIYLYTLEDVDVPESKKEVFNLLYPSVKEMMGKILLK